MSERESDIEFDFFEESETREAAAEERPRRRGRRPPVRPPTGLTPLLRLVGLISFAILIVLLLILWVNSCRESQRKDTYKSYIGQVSDLANQSEALGKRLNTLLTTRGTKETQVEQELTGLAQQQQQLSTRARQIEPPGRLRPEHQAVIEAFDLRVSGLNGMAAAFSGTASSKNSTQAGAGLAGQMKRLVASDVVWDDLFKEPTKKELERQQITGVEIPSSIFIRNPDITTATSMKAVWERIHGASTGGGGTTSCKPRGTEIASVSVLPANKVLSRTTTNMITATRALAFAVTVKDSGCAQEVRLPVRLTIQQAPTPLKGEQTITLINSGQSQTVFFRNLGTPQFRAKTTLTADVDVVPNEANTKNNTARYPIEFVLPTH
jgi:hypothetical protein